MPPSVSPQGPMGRGLGIWALLPLCSGTASRLGYTCVTMIEWFLPAAEEAYRRREQISSVWSQVAGFLKQRRSLVAVTGVAGAGKTVLADHLDGTAFKSGYTPPGRSVKMEKSTVSGRSSSVNLRVVPGQDAPERADALAAILGGKRPVEGLVHVVSFGLPTSRSSMAGPIGAEVTGGDVEEYRASMLQVELEEFRQISELIRAANRRSRRPRFVIVAVSKLDLWLDRISDVKEHYAPERGGRFAKLVRELRAASGSDNLAVEVVPVASWIENVNIVGTTVESKIGVRARDHYLALLTEEILGRMT